MKPLILIACLLLSGCAILEKVAPVQLDAAGQPIAGSREFTPAAKGAMDAIPYGNAAGYTLLALVGVLERFKRNKVEKGLKATLLAGKQAMQDPATKAAFEKLKPLYKNSHESSGVSDLINDSLARI